MLLLRVIWLRLRIRAYWFREYVKVLLVMGRILPLMAATRCIR
jgi:hypothetical protein